MADDRPTIIIKKVKKVDGGHHGGAWKVAYADFVTAMMAFFLLLWLLNVTTDEQKFGIAQYFDPISVSRSTSGSGGILGGKSMVKDGAMVSPTQPMGVDMQMPGVPDTGPNDEEDPDATLQEGQPVTARLQNDESTDQGVDPTDVNERKLEKLIAEKEQAEFDKATEQIRQALQDRPDLAELANHLIIDQTPEGLRIQIVDQDGKSMFPLGSARMYDETSKLIQLVADVVMKLPNKISVTGHTDGKPYRAGASYGNWELSVDRANASRRALINAGIAAQKINHVVGKADKEHLFPDEPLSPRNRRISIVLLRDAKVKEEAKEAKALPGKEDTTSPAITEPAPSSQELDPARPIDALDYE